MKIFIGSSGKKKSQAMEIAKALEREGFAVFGWWDTQVFRGGDVTIDRLVEMSDICDGSVFVFGGDDKLVVEKDGKVIELATTRDNVILEYGVFVSKRGRKKTLFITEEDVKVPTDLAGVIYLNQKDFPAQVVRHFKEVSKESGGAESYRYSTFHLNRNLLNSLAGGGETNWVSRSLYIGSKGANAWKEVENCPDYSGQREFTAVRNLIKRLLDLANIQKPDYVISLGPGLGQLDKEILPHLRGNEWLWYIPVDINFYLASYAAECIDKSSKQIFVPFCIVGDFEDGMSRIAEIIAHKTSPGRAFIMLGGTFGNLEKGEDPFLKGLYDCMDHKDIAILDIFTAGKHYSFDSDPLRHLNEIKSNAVKRFLAGGESKLGQPSVDEIAEDISSYIDARQRNEESSHVPDTNAFEIYSKKTNRPIIIVRRYNFAEFETHIQSLGFVVKASGSTGDDQSIIRRSVFILQKA